MVVESIPFEGSLLGFQKALTPILDVKVVFLLLFISWLKIFSIKIIFVNNFPSIKIGFLNFLLQCFTFDNGLWSTQSAIQKHHPVLGT